MKNRVYAGIDIGSTMTKVILLQSGEILSQIIGPTGPEHRHLAYKVMEKALNQSGINIKDISYIVATGYGRINVPFADRQITEISCHARGVLHLYPSAGLVIDIGGQDSKAIKIINNKVINFVMNDKCAAGTGRFLEVIAEALQVDVGQLGELSQRARYKTSISSYCTIFAEQEVVSRLSEGVEVESIVAGLHEAIAGRAFRLASKLKIEGIKGDVVFTGGVAKNKGMVKALEEHLGRPVLICQEPLITGALGAALKAEEHIEKMIMKGKELEIQERKLDRVNLFINEN
jgi:predicted CoA-substrate-specific enzyme activase